MAPFKSSDGRNIGKLVLSQGTIFLGSGLTEQSQLATGPISASGGSKYTPGNGYIYHAFTTDGAFIQAEGGATLDLSLIHISEPTRPY